MRCHRSICFHWCGREDSNFHGFSPTATSTLRVYQFRHDRMLVFRRRRAYQIGQPRSSRSRWPMEWRIDDDPVDYEAALARMDERAADIRAGVAPELVWLLEHPPLYTAGTSAQGADLLAPGRFPVHRSGRGGQYTYQCPASRGGNFPRSLAPNDTISGTRDSSRWRGCHQADDRSGVWRAEQS